MFLYEPLHKSEQIGGRGFRICVLEFFCFVIYNLYFVNHLEFLFVMLCSIKARVLKVSLNLITAGKMFFQLNYFCTLLKVNLPRKQP